jgi:hypothetical protein
MEKNDEKREKLNAQSREYYHAHLEEMRDYGRKYMANYRKTHPSYANISPKKSRQKTKIEVLTHYGNGKLECIQCGENRLPCLTIDHINGNGNKHRKELPESVRRDFYRYLKIWGFPPEYQTLCMNCQFIKKYETDNKVHHV